MQRVQVLAAARDLPAGSSLGAADLVPLDVPPDLAIPGVLPAGTAVSGRQLATPLQKGQIPTEAQLLGPGLLTGAPAGSAAVPLRIADPASLRLLSPGQLITIVLTGTGGFEARKSEVLATAVPVLWTSAQGGQPGQWLGTGETDGLVVVAADPAQAGRLAGASTQGKLFFVLVNPPAASAGQGPGAAG
ncbi:RcpC/CpaB family pilus assembly protein [Arthrobacter sp. CJ23]|uniref:RcpC/CpaB family pilus assembly protein n=1 Tax=Arthrobacter sp. CJ23 TaxID=2972479 RepID=UPI0028524ACD|nr:RcpC/CpaB family pilus assembly protein [Arthrobacter sp. CJ23]